MRFIDYHSIFDNIISWLQWRGNKRSDALGWIGIFLAQSIIGFIFFTFIVTVLFSAPLNFISVFYAILFGISCGLSGIFFTTLYFILFTQIFNLAFGLIYGVWPLSSSWWSLAMIEWESGGSIPHVILFSMIFLPILWVVPTVFIHRFWVFTLMKIFKLFKLRIPTKENISEVRRQKAHEQVLATDEEALNFLNNERTEEDGLLVSDTVNITSSIPKAPIDPKSLYEGIEGDADINSDKLAGLDESSENSKEYAAEDGSIISPEELAKAKAIAAMREEDKPIKADEVPDKENTQEDNDYLKDYEINLISPEVKTKISFILEQFKEAHFQDDLESFYNKFKVTLSNFKSEEIDYIASIDEHGSILKDVIVTLARSSPVIEQSFEKDVDDISNFDLSGALSSRPSAQSSLDDDNDNNDDDNDDDGKPSFEAVEKTQGQDFNGTDDSNADSDDSQNEFSLDDNDEDSVITSTIVTEDDANEIQLKSVSLLGLSNAGNGSRFSSLLDLAEKEEKRRNSILVNSKENSGDKDDDDLSEASVDAVDPNAPVMPEKPLSLIEFKTKLINEGYPYDEIDNLYVEQKEKYKNDLKIYDEYILNKSTLPDKSDNKLEDSNTENDMPKSIEDDDGNIFEVEEIKEISKENETNELDNPADSFNNIEDQMEDSMSDKYITVDIGICYQLQGIITATQSYAEKKPLFDEIESKAGYSILDIIRSEIYLNAVGEAPCSNSRNIYNRYLSENTVNNDDEYNSTIKIVQNKIEYFESNKYDITEGTLNPLIMKLKILEDTFKNLPLKIRTEKTLTTSKLTSKLNSLLDLVKNNNTSVKSELEAPDEVEAISKEELESAKNFFNSISPNADDNIQTDEADADESDNDESETDESDNDEADTDEANTDEEETSEETSSETQDERDDKSSSVSDEIKDQSDEAQGDILSGDNADKLDNFVTANNITAKVENNNDKEDKEDKSMTDVVYSWEDESLGDLDIDYPEFESEHLPGTVAYLKDKRAYDNLMGSREIAILERDEHFNKIKLEQEAEAARLKAIEDEEAEKAELLNNADEIMKINKANKAEKIELDKYKAEIESEREAIKLERERLSKFEEDLKSKEVQIQSTSSANQDLLEEIKNKEAEFENKNLSFTKLNNLMGDNLQNNLYLMELFSSVFKSVNNLNPIHNSLKDHKTSYDNLMVLKLIYSKTRASSVGLDNVFNDNDMPERLVPRYSILPAINSSIYKLSNELLSSIASHLEFDSSNFIKMIESIDDLSLQNFVRDIYNTMKAAKSDFTVLQNWISENLDDFNNSEKYKAILEDNMLEEFKILKNDNNLMLKTLEDNGIKVDFNNLSNPLDLEGNSDKKKVINQADLDLENNNELEDKLEGDETIFNKNEYNLEDIFTFEEGLSEPDDIQSYIDYAYENVVFTPYVLNDDFKNAYLVGETLIIIGLISNHYFRDCLLAIEKKTDVKINNIILFTNIDIKIDQYILNDFDIIFSLNKLHRLQINSILVSKISAFTKS